MFRNVGAVLAGLLTGFAIIVGAEMIGHQIYPPPPGIDFTNPEAMASLAAQMPAGAFAFVLGGWLFAAGVGAGVAMRIAKSASLRPGLTVGLILFAATAYNLFAIPHPVWVSATAIIGIPLVTWLAATRARVSQSPG